MILGSKTESGRRVTHSPSRRRENTTCRHRARQPRGDEQLLAQLPRIRAGVSAKLKDANTKDRKFEDVAKDAQQAAVLVLVY